MPFSRYFERNQVRFEDFIVKLKNCLEKSVALLISLADSAFSDKNIHF